MMQAALKRVDLTTQYKLQEYFKAEMLPLTEFEAMIETIEYIGLK